MHSEPPNHTFNADAASGARDYETLDTAMTNDTPAKIENRVPVICAHPSTVAGAEIFDPNSWFDGSKGVIHSCWSEYSVLHYCVNQISNICANAEQLCAQNIAALQEQWKLAKFDLGKMVFFGQQPELHIRIEAFFSGVKTLLDLLVQLLTTEKIVGGDVDGFHRDKDVYGGRVLNALRGNATKERKDMAAKLDGLISENKRIWIDQLILARDLLVHPEKGMQQLMFNLELAEKGGALVCTKAHPPEINSKPIHLYAQETLTQIAAFSSSFLGLLREKAVSNQSLERTR